MTLELLVLADDRSGALETAGACADAGLSSVMTPYDCDDSDLPPHRCRVVDLGTRQLSAAEAERRVVDIEIPTQRLAHKIDSTLKGNWAVELAAHPYRTLLIPSVPAAGRTCVGGVVHVLGEPIGRPADHLDRAGADHVVIADAATDEEIDALVERWLADPTLRLAGTAGVIGAAARAISGAVSPTATVPPPVAGRALVVCGSRQPMARAQVAAVSPLHRVVLSPHDLTYSSSVLRALADEVDSRLHDTGVLVVVGGDTAAAVLGDRAMVVGGTLEVGVAWSRFADGSGPLVLTKPGSFGDEFTIARVLASILSTEY